MLRQALILWGLCALASFGPAAYTHGDVPAWYLALLAVAFALPGLLAGGLVLVAGRRRADRFMPAALTAVATTMVFWGLQLYR